MVAGVRPGPGTALGLIGLGLVLALLTSQTAAPERAARQRPASTFQPYQEDVLPLPAAEARYLAGPRDVRGHLAALFGLELPPDLEPVAASLQLDRSAGQLVAAEARVAALLDGAPVQFTAAWRHPGLPRPALPPLVHAERGNLPAGPPRLAWEASEVQFSATCAGPACTAELVWRLAFLLETAVEHRRLA